MPKLAKHKRKAMTYQIEDMLENYCRVYPSLGSYKIEPICITCPVGVGLRKLGSHLGGSDTVPISLKNVVRSAWSNDEDMLILQLKENGMSYREIAEKLGRTTASISNRLRRLGGYSDD